MILYFLVSSAAFSTNITINGSSITIGSDEKNSVDLNTHWRFCIGDTMDWAKAEFDHSKWDTVYFPFTTQELIPFGYKGNAWFRTTFTINSSQVFKPLSFFIKQFGASEIYIDGKLIHQFGKVGHQLSEEQSFNPQNFPVSFILENSGTHTIAIRYSNHSALNSDDDESDLEAFDLKIVDAERALAIHKIRIFKENILTSIGIGIFLTLSIINFILFLFYKRDKANLYYSLFSFAVSIGFIISAIEYTCTLPTTAILLERLSIVFLVVSNFFLVALVYSFIYNNTPKRLWILLALSIGVILFVFIQFDMATILSNVLNVYCVIEIVVIVLKNYFKHNDPSRKKRKILRIVLISMVALACLGLLIHKMISLIIFIALVLIVLIPVAGLIFIVPLYMTIRHARSFAVTNQSLEEQLVQVKELSAKTLEQEQEKKRILESQNERLEQLVVERTAELAEKNNEIKDSITYAQRIQRAILTSKAEINATLKNCFVLFKPKDIVSGDFYFYAEKNNTVLIAAADCTGHGVPGALMSMIASEKLMAAVAESTDPSVILNLVNKGIKSSLKQSDHEESTRDGMDIVLVSLDLKHNKAYYSGANRPIWIIRNGGKEFEELKATKKAIGGFTPDEQHYDLHELELKAGDTFYVFTDGYADQFGHTGKKLMTKKFRELLLSIQHLSMQEQENYLDDFIENWKQDVEQVDDILVIGVRI